MTDASELISAIHPAHIRIAPTTNKICAYPGCDKPARNKGRSPTGAGGYRFGRFCRLHHKYSTGGGKKALIDNNMPCEICGWQKALNDRYRPDQPNRYNHIEVIIVCPNCHREIKSGHISVRRLKTGRVATTSLKKFKPPANAAAVQVENSVRTYEDADRVDGKASRVPKKGQLDVRATNLAPKIPQRTTAEERRNAIRDKMRKQAGLDAFPPKPASSVLGSSALGSSTLDFRRPTSSATGAREVEQC